VIPAGNFWTMVKRGPSLHETIDCAPLPATGPIEWWHRLLGIATYDLTLGKGINVGIIDTGCGPHPFLSHVTDAGSFIGGQTTTPPDPKQDVDSHGSHVCGIIGARPTGTAYAGVAPGASLFCARVFPGPEQPANQGDIAKAIDTLSMNYSVDLINLSLGATQASQIEHDSITDAYERGTLCICAAGNDSSAVNWPAQFDECAAVSAVGIAGWGPAGSLAASRLPVARDRFGRDGYFLANFSSFGPQLLCAGPGVGYISTVPTRYGLTSAYLAMDGTSMASPAVTGALAALLSKCVPYTALARDRSRAEFAKAILRQSCQDLGLSLQYQGLGIPKIPIGNVSLLKM
jgi:subtilisin